MHAELTSETLSERPNAADAKDDRPVLAIVCNAQTPYRLHLHRRVAAEIPEVKLHSLYQWEIGKDAFTAVEDSIGPVSLWDGKPPRRFPGRLAQEWAIGGRIIDWLARRNVAAVVSLGYSDLTRARVLRWCQRQKFPTMMWGDSNIRADRPRGLRRILKRAVVTRVVRGCDALLPCGSLGRDYFLRYGAQPERIFYFPNEPDYGLIWNCPPERIEGVRSRFSLKAERRRIVYSGRLISFKRVDLAVDAFAAIADRRPEWDLVIAGRGPVESELRARVPQQLAGRVIWTGFLDQPDLSAVYRLSDVLVLPSDHEPWALVLNESAAAGMAIVCSDVVGAAPELVSPDENGMTFPAGDLGALTSALLHVTDGLNTDRMKSASPRVLDRWRQKADPVAGLRRALESCGVLPLQGGAASAHQE